jgi:NADH:ubiquinone oxidoreductase subunit
MWNEWMEERHKKEHYKLNLKERDKSDDEERDGSAMYWRNPGSVVRSGKKAKRKGL